MDQFLSKLLDKYGLARMVIAVLIGFIALWGLAHFTSAPGGNVSLFWGLVQYTKDSPTRSVAAPLKNKYPLTSSASLPVVTDDIGIIHGLTKQTFDTTLQSVRTKRHLRPLEALESGRSVAETPRGTYFFIPHVYLATSSAKMLEKLDSTKVSRFKDRSWYFEIHYPKTGAPVIMALTHESDAVRLVSPNQEIQKISIAAVPWEKMTSLVSLPADRIMTAKERTLNLTDGDMYVLDLEIK